MKTTRSDAFLLLLLMAIFWLGVLRHIDLPGLYMDAVNPDYLVARAINPRVWNPDWLSQAWLVPTATFPILGNLYHGVQNYYFELLSLRVLGVSVASVRISQAFFGALTVAFLYVTAVILTRNRLAAFIGAALLACDIAFIASFRTQFYIILGGEMWLFASLMALYYGRPLGFFLSGVCFGLSTYGYFVLGFFAPAMAVLVLARPDRRPFHWIGGFCVGLLPYVAGYASLVSAQGDLHGALAWLQAATRGLAPLSSHLSLLDSLRYTSQIAWFALSDAGNESMLFGRSVSGVWAVIKVATIVAIILAFLVRGKETQTKLLILMPASYFCVAAIFGSRLWAHHFSTLVPVAYLLLAAAAAEFLSGNKHRLLVFGVAIVFVAGNLHQGNNFYRALEATGGVGKTTDALSRLATDARDRPDTLYVFPDWGFFMSFNLLTENRVPYVLDADHIADARGERTNVEIVFWAPSDEKKYRDALTAAGAKTVESRAYYRRDGMLAFEALVGRF